MNRVLLVLLLVFPGTADERMEKRQLVSELLRVLDAQAYASQFEERFTADELRLLIEFFRTKHGQKLAGMLSQEGEQEAKPPWRQTMSDLRTLGTLAEMRATDENVYPQVAFDELEPLFVPTYTRTIPEVDAWGTPFLYVSDGEHYRFVSAGADRRFEWNAGKLDLSLTEPRSSGDLDADIIFQDGVFVQAPKEP